MIFPYSQTLALSPKLLSVSKIETYVKLGPAEDESLTPPTHTIK